MERGAIQAVKDTPWKDKTFYSFKVNGEWYSSGMKKPPAEGSYVEFEYEVNGRGYKDVKGAVRQVESVGGVSRGTRSAAKDAKLVTKDDYWNRKEERDLEWQNHQRNVVQPKIELQAARNAAIEVVKIFTTPTAIEGKMEYMVKPPAQAKRKEWIEAMIDELTAKFVGQNNEKFQIETHADEDAQPSPVTDEEGAVDQDSWRP